MLLLLLAFILQTKAQDACGINMVPAAIPALQTKAACDDLYAFACQGSTELAEKHRKIQAKLKEKLQNTMDEAAREAGHKSHFEYLKDYLKKQGIEISSNVKNIEAIEEMVEDPDVAEFGNFFGDFGDCASAIQDNSHYSGQESVADIATKVEKQRALRESTETALAIDVFQDPDLFLTVVGRRCKDWRELTSKSDKDNKEIAKICEPKNYDKFNVEFSDVYRNNKKLGAGAAGTQTFFKKYSPAWIGLSGDFSKKKSEKSFAGGRYQALERENQYLGSTCKMLGFVKINKIKAEVEIFQTKFTNSLPFAKAVVKNYYSDEDKAALTSTLAVSADKSSRMLASLVGDEQKAKALKAGFENLKFSWPGTVDASQFSYDKEMGVSVRVGGDPYLDEALGPGNLGNYTQLNAAYVLDVTYGKKEVTAEQIIVHPALLEYQKSNSIGMLAVMGHELGHKNDNIVTQYSRTNIRSHYSHLLKCFSDADSVAASPNQSQELIGDQFGAEHVAEALSKYPQNERAQKAAEAVSLFCDFDQQRKDRRLTFQSTHPSPYFRINGVFGANAAIRKQLGCKDPSPKFKSCDFK